MPYQNINATLDNNDLIAHIKNIQVIKDSLPFLVNLTPKERQAGILGQNKLAFVNAAYDYATNYPTLVPAALNATNWASDIALLAQLTQLMQAVSVLQDALKDTTLALRIESQTAALQFYQYAKIAAQGQVPGVDVIVDDLKKKLG
jgi:hypothetical protein